MILFRALHGTALHFVVNVLVRIHQLPFRTWVGQGAANLARFVCAHPSEMTVLSQLCTL
jgi:hypothetical protein